MARLGAILIACVAAIVGSGAAAAPITNKTVEIEWTSVGSGRRLGDNRTITWNNVHRGTIYVSTAGRVFMRRSFSGLGRGGGSESVERGPDQVSAQGSVRWAGNQIIGTHTQPSGAVQVVVSFSPGFTSCSLRVIYGRAGAKMQIRGPGGGTFEVDSIQAAQPSCRVAEGNGL